MNRIGLVLLLFLFVQSFIFVEESSTAQQNSPAPRSVQSNVKPAGDNLPPYAHDASQIVTPNKETGETDTSPSIAEDHINAILKSIVVVIIGVIIILRLRMRKSRLSIINSDKRINNVQQLNIREDREAYGLNTVRDGNSALLHNRERIVEKQISPDNKKTTCIKHGKWIVVGASVIGKSHLRNNPPDPCQDSHSVIKIDDEWGVAVVCDGAGSAQNSHFGATFTAEKTANLLKYIVKKNKWHKRDRKGNYDKFPFSDWHLTSQMVFDSIFKELEKYSKDKGYSIETMACTVIIAIYSPVGILIAHIGDGRAAYCNAQGQWKAMMTPIKGEEANQTIFITSPIWNDLDRYMEAQVVKDDISAFALMSDGCESHSFEVNLKKEDEEKYYDPNNPYEKFFNPLVANLQDAYKSKTLCTEVEEKWGAFIEAGNSGLMNEPDDKTMIMGAFVK
jgi:hypothetical protein